MAVYNPTVDHMVTSLDSPTVRVYRYHKNKPLDGGKTWTFKLVSITDKPK